MDENSKISKEVSLEILKEIENLIRKEEEKMKGKKEYGEPVFKRRFNSILNSILLERNDITPDQWAEIGEKIYAIFFSKGTENKIKPRNENMSNFSKEQMEKMIKDSAIRERSIPDDVIERNMLTNEDVNEIEIKEEQEVIKNSWLNSNIK